MRWQGLVLKAMAQAVSWTRCVSAPRAGLRVLTYHTVGQRAYGDALNLNTISVEQFKLHLDLLKNYNCIALQGMDFPAQETKVAITFDDGYADNLYVVAPLLMKRNIPFTVFVTSRFVRDQIHGFLSSSELKELALLQGVTIGAHGNTHCDLTRCDEAGLNSELKDSKAYLEDLLGKPITSMAYPYGAANRRVRAAVEACGYTIAASSYFDINRPGQDPLMLSRGVILNGDSCKVLDQKIKGAWDWYRLRMTNPLHL
jgi:peptidoglycan/xylan/chitin deacetylase (PgdA/CDA1 family)